MPFRLDYALWSALLAVVVLRRSDLLSPTDNEYLSMKFTTKFIVYSYFFAIMYFADTYLSSHFTPENVFLHQAANSVLVVAVDLLKAALFSSLILKAKIDHLVHLAKSLRDACFTLDGIKGNFKFLSQVMVDKGTFFEWDEGKAVRKSICHQIWYFEKSG